MSANHTGGGRMSEAAYARYWDRFDALPVQVKAAFWDGVVPWNHTRAVNNPTGLSDAGLVAQVESWDAQEVTRRALWLRKPKPGVRTRDLPPSPHQAAGVTVLRAHRQLSNPPRYKRVSW